MKPFICFICFIWGAMSLACVLVMTISGDSEWANLVACFACSFVVCLIAAAKF